MSDTINTKEILAETLKILTKKKSFAKITIADITQGSGFNRQTFYYHFKDKYELLSWTYEQDAKTIIDDQMNFENWHRYMASLLKLIQQQASFYRNTISCDETVFRDFIFSLTRSIFFLAIDTLDQHHQISQHDKNFYSEFFSFGIAGVIISWIKAGMKEAPEKIASNMKSLAQDSEKLAYERYRTPDSKTNDEEDLYETENRRLF